VVAGMIAMALTLSLVFYIRGLEPVAQPSVEEFLFRGLISWA
jgi:hypothetical protein